MKWIFSMLLISTSAYSHSLNDKRGWMRVSDPAIMSASERTFANLPLEGEASNSKRNWSSNHWQMNRGGINFRWNAETPNGFDLKSPSKAEALEMTEAELAQLAPTEKWDLFNGRYKYPLVLQITGYARQNVPDWFGICDGWAGAASNHDEPEPKVLTNVDGVKIPFGSSDFKALLSWYYARVHRDGYAYTGQRCNTDETNPRCQNDMNAGAFHLILGNRLGLNGLSFVTELNHRSPVSNHLAANYKSEILEENLPPSDTAAPDTVTMVRVKTTVWYVQEAPNSWTPVLGTELQNNQPKEYLYYIELDEQGHVVGGEWISEERPDFLWLSKKVLKFTGHFERLHEALSKN